MPKRNRQVETKAVAFEGVGFDHNDGIIEGIAAVFGNVDAVRDRLHPGSCQKSINDHATNFLKLPMGLDHDEGFGVTLDMEEVGREDLPQRVRSEAPEANGGLYCKGQVVMSDTNIKRIESMKRAAASGRPPRMSFTYRPITDSKSRSPRGEIRELHEVAITEWGPQTHRRRAVNAAAQVTAVKSTPAGPGTEEKADPLPGSLEEKRERIRDAIQDSELATDDQYAWPIATMPTHVIVHVEPDDAADYYVRVDYVDVNGVIVLGEITEVEVQTVVTEKAVNAEAKALATINRLSAEMKAGRVLSQSNLDALEAAISELQRIRAAAVGTSDTDSEDDDPESEEKAARAALQDRWQLLDLELGLIETNAALAAL